MLDIAPETNEVIDEIRRSVAALCEKFPGEYWREQDRERAYPTEFVKALTDAGFLAVLVPEEYGGSGLPISAAAAVLEEIHKSGCNGGACHAQMYIMGTVLRHGSPEQKQKFLPKKWPENLALAGRTLRFDVTLGSNHPARGGSEKNRRSLSFLSRHAREPKERNGNSSD